MTKTATIMKAPCFSFYANDFLSSLSVRAMSSAERGGYLMLLLNAWQGDEQGYIVDDDELLYVSSGMTPDEWEKSKARLLRKFPLASEKLGYRYNPRMLIEAEKQKARRENLSKNGAKGGRPKGEDLGPEKLLLSKEKLLLSKTNQELPKVKADESLTFSFTSTLTNKEQSVSTDDGADAPVKQPSEIRLAAMACKTVDELTVLWKANPSRHEETGFRQLFTECRRAVEAAPTEADFKSKPLPKAKPRAVRTCDELIDKNQDPELAFDAFWGLYLPFQGADKFDAKKIWVTLPAELRKTTLAGLPAWVAGQLAENREMRFRRHAPTFLNANPWDDETFVRPAKAPLVVSHRNGGGVAPTETYVPSYQQKIREQATKTYR